MILHLHLVLILGHYFTYTPFLHADLPFTCRWSFISFVRVLLCTTFIVGVSQWDVFEADTDSQEKGEEPNVVVEASEV